MASKTQQLGLLKKNPTTDGSDTFNIETMLNENWDKLDAHAKFMVLFAATKGKANGLAELDSEGKVKGIPSNLETTTGAQQKIDAAIAALVDGAPGAIDTLRELAKALGDDPNFSTTMINRLAAIELSISQHKAEDASVTKKGHVQLSDAITSTDTNKAATSNAVKKAYDRADQAFLSASNGKNMLTNAITGTDPRVVIPQDPSFGQLATAVRQIQTGKRVASGNYTVASERKSFPSYITGNKDDVLYVNYQNFIQINGLAFEPSLIFVKGVAANASTLYKKEGIFTKGGRTVVASSLNDFGYPITENTALSVTGQSFCLPITVDGGMAVTWIAYE